MNDVWNLPEDGEEELPETEESPEEASERERFLPSEQRSAVDSTRRDDEERRQSEESFEGEEKRQEPQRRSEEKRRGISTTSPARPPAPSASSRIGWMTTAKASGRSLSRTWTTTWLIKISGSCSNTQKGGKNSSGTTSIGKNENHTLIRTCFYRGANGASGGWLFVVRHREVFPRRRQDRLRFF